MTVMDIGVLGRAGIYLIGTNMKIRGVFNEPGKKIKIFRTYQPKEILDMAGHIFLHNTCWYQHA